MWRQGVITEHYNAIGRCRTPSETIFEPLCSLRDNYAMHQMVMDGFLDREALTDTARVGRSPRKAVP